MTTQNSTRPKDEDFFQLQDLLYYCILKWHWLAISLCFAIIIAILYIKITPPIYTRTAAVVIKDESKGSSLSAEATGFADLGFLQTNTNVNNELISLKSPDVVLETIKRLHLEIDYVTGNIFNQKVLYGKDLPIIISFTDKMIRDTLSTSFTLHLLPQGKVELSDFDLSDGSTVYETITGSLNDTIITPSGTILIQPSSYYNFYQDQYEPIHIKKSKLYSVTESYLSKLSVSLADEKSSVINISVNDHCIQRATDFINTLISVYNERWIKDKNQTAISTSMFINERLKVIESELGHVDKDISSYKSENLLPDIQAASTMYMTQANETNNQILALNNQLYMARYIKNYLMDSSYQQLIPANSGIESTNLEQQISEYNTMQLQRNNLVANSSEENPLVISLDQSLIAMREAIILSINNLMVTLNAQIKNLERTERETTARIAANPTQAQHLLTIERQQKVKESLYLFLLQKREENELSQAFTAYNTRIITAPYGKMTPTSPKKTLVFLIAIVLGVLTPAVIIFLKENLNTTVRGRKDLEVLTIPFIGEIPLAFRKKKQWLPRKKDNESRQAEYKIVVKERSRNIINEAFRVVRTNLEFMSGKDGKSKIIMFTSFNPGSGKTFTSMNLATSLAIKGKKILAIDLDMRKASFSLYISSPKIGVSNYLSGQIDQLDDIIVKGKTHKNLDIIPVGTIPPNPTELLFENRLEEMLNTLRKEYDYIFIDCPPVEIVADSAIINKLTDMTLFVIRTGLMNRHMLPEVEKLYTEHKYKNMGVILNGTMEAHGTYGGYYKYGYQSYGYGEKE